MKKQGKWEVTRLSGTYKRPWFLKRRNEAIYHKNSVGNVIYFASCKTANCRACKLNAIQAMKESII